MQAAYPGDIAGQSYIPVGPEVEETTTVEKILAMRTKQVRLLLLYKLNYDLQKISIVLYLTHLLLIHLSYKLKSCVQLFCRMKNLEIMRNFWSSLRTSEFEFCPVFK